MFFDFPDKKLQQHFLCCSFDVFAQLAMETIKQQIVYCQHNQQLDVYIFLLKSFAVCFLFSFSAVSCCHLKFFCIVVALKEIGKSLFCVNKFVCLVALFSFFSLGKMTSFGLVLFKISRYEHFLITLLCAIYLVKIYQLRKDIYNHICFNFSSALSIFLK